MEYTKPVIYNIPAFDALKKEDRNIKYKLGFTALTDAPNIITANMNIYNTVTDTLIGAQTAISLLYNEEESNAQLSVYNFKIPEGYELVNGEQYYMTISVTNSDGTIITSDAKNFWCYTTPVITWVDSFDYCFTPSCKIKFKYEQVEGEYLSSYQLFLYLAKQPEGKELIDESPILYGKGEEIHQYVFDNLVNECSYIVNIKAKTQEGTEIEEELASFTVSYTKKSNKVYLGVYNNAEKGRIEGKTYFDAILGKSDNATIRDGLADTLYMNYDKNGNETYSYLYPNIKWEPNIKSNIFNIKLWNKGDFIPKAEGLEDINTIYKMTTNDGKHTVKIVSANGEVAKNETETVYTGTVIVDNYYVKETNSWFGIAGEGLTAQERELYHSNDGLTWNKCQITTSSGQEAFKVSYTVYHTLCYSGKLGVYFLASSNPNGDVCYSTDGVAWKPFKTEPSVSFCNGSIIYTGKYLYCFDSAGYSYTEVNNISDLESTLSSTRVVYSETEICKPFFAQYNNGWAYGVTTNGYLFYGKPSEVDGTLHFWNETPEPLDTTPVETWFKTINMFYIKGNAYIYTPSAHYFVLENRGDDIPDFSMRTNKSLATSDSTNVLYWEQDGLYFRYYMGNENQTLLYSYNGDSWYPLKTYRFDHGLTGMWLVGYKLYRLIDPDVGGESNKLYSYDMNYDAQYELRLDDNVITSTKVENVPYDHFVCVNALVSTTDDTFNVGESSIEVVDYGKEGNL